MRKSLLISFLVLLCNPLLCSAGSVTDYLILEDIQPYKLFTGIQGRVFSGPPSKYSQTATSGVLWAVGHLKYDHENYNASYTRTGSKWPFVKVEVTVHNDPEASIWVLHELDVAYRANYGIPDPSYFINNIDGNTILEYSAGGRDYRWISGNKVVQIEYDDSMMTLPEPIEVVKAYLNKHPSTIPTITLKELRSNKNVEIWIKTEIDRRLWLCEKRILKLENGFVPETDDLYFHFIKNDLNVFLAYREKYFHKKSVEDKQLIDGFRGISDISTIKNKLAEYRAWWEKHNNDSISIPKI